MGIEKYIDKNLEWKESTLGVRKKIYVALVAFVAVTVLLGVLEII